MSDCRHQKWVCLNSVQPLTLTLSALTTDSSSLSSFFPLVPIFSLSKAPQPHKCLRITRQFDKVWFLIQTKPHQGVYLYVILCPLSGTTQSFYQTTWQKCLFTSYIYSYLSFGVKGFPFVKCWTFTFSLWLWNCDVNWIEQKHSGHSLNTTLGFEYLSYTVTDKNCIYMTRKTLMRFVQMLDKTKL